jgi:hypothetical protein
MKFTELTKYIDIISQTDDFGEWVIDNKNDGTHEHPILWPYVAYSALISTFEKDFYSFEDSNKKYKLYNYREILKSNGLLGNVNPRDANVNNCDEICTLALIFFAIRAERFCDGVLLECFEDGLILKWLKRLRELDEAENKSKIESDP